MNIDKKFLLDRQGKTFVLYAGLLDAAHTAGIKTIRTTLLQPPLEQNGHTTIVAAEVELGDGRVFTGIGDANERNVGRNIAVHAIRMAETRAKARALRDALNIGAVSLEELGGEDEEAPAPLRPIRKPVAVEERPAPPAADEPIALPLVKEAYTAAELRRFRDAEKAPANLESAAVRFAEEVFAVTGKAIPVPKDKGMDLLVWLTDMTARWENSPKNPRHPQAEAV